MRVFKRGAYYIVKCSFADVLDFAGKWPCYGTIRPLQFEFDKDGNLVDIIGEHEDNDQGGIKALSEDAQKYMQSF